MTLTLQYLRREFFDKTGANEALEHFKHSRPATRLELLRHHREGAISNDETWERDHYDYLISYYGLLECAFVTGFIREIPRAIENEAREVLEDDAVRRYYRDNYPVRIAGFFLQRIDGRRSVKEWDKANVESLFMTFLELTKIIEFDDDVEMFLWFLEGGWRRGVDLSNTLAALNSPETFFKGLAAGPRNLRMALHGFCKFLDFCSEFDRLCRDCESYPESKRCFWLYHEYWFRELKKDFGSKLRTAITAVSTWGVDQKAAAQRRKEAVLSALDRLERSEGEQQRQQLASH